MHPILARGRRAHTFLLHTGRRKRSEANFRGCRRCRRCRHRSAAAAAAVAICNSMDPIIATFVPPDAENSLSLSPFSSMSDMPFRQAGKAAEVFPNS